MESVIKLFDKVAFAALIFMLFVVVTSILGRLLFDLTGGAVRLILPGSIELSSYSLLIMVFSSMPRAAVNGLVSVELLIGALPAIIRRILEGTWDLVLATFAVVVGWLFFERMLEMYIRGGRTQELGIPLYLFYGALSICCIGIMLTSLWLALSRQRPTFNEE